MPAAGREEPEPLYFRGKSVEFKGKGDGIMRKTNVGLMVAALTVLVVGLMVLPACKSREKAAEEMAEGLIEKATGGKVDIDISSGGMKVTTKEGEITWGETAEWPNDIPSDVPRFTYGKVTGLVRAHEASAKNWSLVLGDVEEGGLAKYSETLKGNGWEILASFQSADGETVTAQKGNMSLTLGYNKSQKAGSFHVAVKAE